MNSFLIPEIQKSKMTASRLVIIFLLSFVSSGLWAEADTAWWNLSGSNDTALNHSSYSRILETYIIREDGMNKFRYKNVSRKDIKELSSYVEYLQNLPVRQLTRETQLEVWLNLYNASTLLLILEHYPVKSIRNIKFGKPFAFGPWDREILTVEGKKLSLNDIEHRIVRPLWNDARLHYAFNCASLGCPDLKRTPWNAKSMNDDLDRAAEAFINHPRAVSPGKRKTRLSSIYKWYREDFEKEGGLTGHLKKYAKRELSENLTDKTGYTYDYDWNLNER